MIKRTKTLAGLKDLFRTFPAVVLLGARQVGKTTLAVEFAKRSASRATVFDLEDPADLSRLSARTGPAIVPAPTIHPHHISEHWQLK